jgi:hypothetical protein
MIKGHIKQKSLDELNAEAIMALPPLKLFELMYDEDNVSAIYRKCPALEQRMQKLSAYYASYVEAKTSGGEADILVVQDVEDAEEVVTQQQRIVFFALLVAFVNLLISLFASKKEKVAASESVRPSVFADTNLKAMADASDKLYSTQKPHAIKREERIASAEFNNEKSSACSYRLR